MSVFVKCPGCATALRTQPPQLGRRARCTKCGLVFRLASPVGQRIEHDEPETPQVIEEPPAQQQTPPPPEPLPLPDDDPPMAEEIPTAPQRPARRKPTAEQPPRRKQSEPVRRSSRGLLAAVAAVVLAAVAVGGVFLYRHLSAPDKPKAEGPEVAAADASKEPPAKGTNPAAGKKDPNDGKPEPVVSFPAPVEVKDRPADPPVDPKPPVGKQNPPDPQPQPAPPKPLEPTTVRLDAAVSAVYPGGGGKYLVFHHPAALQLSIYDVAQARVVGTISNLDQNSHIAVGRDKVFVGRWRDWRVVRFDLRTGAQEALAVPQGQEQLNHLAVGNNSDGPLLAVVTGADKKYQARLLDHVTLNPLDVPISDPARADPRAFPFAMPVGPSHVAVSADGRAFCLSDRLYTRTATGYSAAQINPSSALRPSPDGKVALGNSLWGEDGKTIRFEDRAIRWFLPAADGPFWLAVEYARGAGRNARVLLHADRDTKPLGELPGADELTDWLGRNNTGVTGLHRVLTFLPDPGLVVLVPGGSREVKFFPVDLPALVANAGRDVVFTSVPPVAAPKDRPYAHTARAAAGDGGKVTFALEAGPQGMTVTPDGTLAWTPGESFADPTADVKLVAKTAAGKQAVQQFRLFLSTPRPGTPVAVLPKNDPIVPKKDPGIPKKDPAVPKIDPVVPKKDPPAVAGGPAKSIDLPGAAASVAVGGSGRLVCLYLPAQRQVAIFDAAQGKVAKYIPTPGNKALVAAGADKLFVVSPDEGAVQRWDLKTFEKEVTVPLPDKGVVKGAYMGAASAGPLWLVGGDRFGGALTALDTKTLRAIELKPDGNGLARGLGEGVRVSADGRTIGTWRFGSSPSGLTVLTLTDKTLKGHYEHDSVGHVTPAPDGRLVHTAIGRFTPEGKSLGDRDGEPGHGAKGTSYSFPATEGSSLYLNVTFGRAAGGPPRPGAKGNGTLAVHWAADGKKLADLPDVSVGEINVWDREPIGNDQRFMLVPSAKTLVVLPPTNDKLLLYPFDLDAVLDKSGKDYLLVEAPGAAGAVRGEPFAQNLFIKSKKGGVKAKVDSGPDGLTVTPDGRVSWAVPKDFADDEAIAIITVSDASGQEVLQTLRLPVRGEKGAPVAVVPKKDPVVQPKDPPKDPPPARKGEAVTVKLPGAAKAAVVGAGGKYLILLLPQQKQIAIVDVAAGKVAKYLPAAEEGALIAAGIDHLMVANPTARVIQRYNLKTFEKEATLQQPIDGTVAALAMGSASKGPLLICPTADMWGGAKLVLVDPVKMKVIPDGDKLGAAAAPFVRASADGRMFGWRNGTGSEGHDMTLVEVIDGKPKPRTFGAGTSLLLPSPDGRYVYCGEGVFNSQFKKLHPTNENNRLDRPFLPAVSGNLFMQLEPGGAGARFPGDPMAQPGPGRVHFFLPGQYRAFASVKDVEGLAGESYGYGGVPDVMMHDRRIHLFPDAGRLAAIPTTNDKVVLHPFDLDDLLEKSGTDYLLVASDPPAEAVRGAEFSYKPVVKSKKGGVKVKLDAGPDGMKYAGGELVWKVPENFADKEVDVILTISDATGQEMFQTFKLALRDR